MQLSDILRPNAVKFIASKTSKKRLLQDLSAMAQGAYGLDGSQTCTALQQRENLGPTGIGKGIALPHARVSGLTEMVGAFIRLENPIDFNAADRQPVDLIFGLFAPEDSGVEHLKALALVSRTMRDTSISTKLRANDRPDTLFTILTETSANRAA